MCTENKKISGMKYDCTVPLINGVSKKPDTGGCKTIQTFLSEPSKLSTLFKY